MKITSIVACLVLLSSIAFAQITSREIAKKEEPKSQPWDSLTYPKKGSRYNGDFLVDDFRFLVGQTFYLPAQSKKCSSAPPVGIPDFLSDPKADNRGEKESYYHPVVIAEGANQYNGVKWYRYNADYKAVTNQNFTIIDLFDPYDDAVGLTLLHPTLHDTAYYQFDPKKLGEVDFIIMATFEKHKKMSVGQPFVFVGGIVTSSGTVVEANDVTTGKPVKVAIRSEWTCIDYTLIERETHCKPVLAYIFKNAAGEEVAVGTGPLMFKEFKSKKILQEETKAELKKAADQEKQRKADDAEEKRIAAAQKKEYIAKFGQQNGTLVAQGKVAIGMTKEMCVAAWGSPEDTHTTITAGRTREQWVYSTMRSYLYFEGNKLVAIQD